MGFMRHLAKNSRASEVRHSSRMLCTNRNPVPIGPNRGFLPFLGSRPQGEVSLKEVGNEVAIPQPVSQISEAIEKCGANPSLKLFYPHFHSILNYPLFLPIKIEILFEYILTNEYILKSKYIITCISSNT